MTNCVNCGAPLRRNVCDYCGTEYKDRVLKGCFDDMTGELEISGNKYRVYLETVGIHDMLDTYRDQYGRLNRQTLGKKHIFKFIEM